MINLPNSQSKVYYRKPKPITYERFLATNENRLNAFVNKRMKELDPYLNKIVEAIFGDLVK
jgi:hypothetical protein